MKIWKKIILGTVLLVFEYSMFQISLELGLASLVLICAVFSIWIVLHKITTVTVHPELILSSAPFRDSPDSKNNDLFPVNSRALDTEALIPGVNANIFEQFREKLNLSPTIDSPPSVESLSDEDFTNSPKKTGTTDLVTEAYQKAGTFNATDNFSEELDEVEKVRVTLSENAKFRQEKNEVDSENKHEIDLEEKQDLDEGADQAEAEIQANINNDNLENHKKLGAGEAELEILSSKHHALKKQRASVAEEQPEDFDEDLFADELISIPGGEINTETYSEIFSDEDPFQPLSSEYSLEDDEPLGLSSQNINSQQEIVSEAEALLRLATTACEADKMDEAKASLDGYLDILKELDQNPSPDVLYLADRLDLPLSSLSENATVSKTKLTKKEVEKKQTTSLKDAPDQTNYANVMDGIVKSLEEKDAYEEALPLLRDLLNYNRQRVNISAMDPLYDRIEKAHSSMQNDEELVTAYKEHLSIKQQLGDLEGELHLLDLISYYYANTSDQKASERYQAESKRIKASLDGKTEMR